ncbi:DUF6201 family protein [Plesiomonas shigelloides]|uniref:DUF6201 family protein n=1 Tax=Plesiomonas shigelloides TaxID=703 RepID=UPI001CE31EDF
MEKLAKCLGWLCVIYWLLLAHESLKFLCSHPEIVRVAEDGKYSVTINDMYPVNPIGRHCFFNTESQIYFSLYDTENKDIGHRT